MTVLREESPLRCHSPECWQGRMCHCADRPDPAFARGVVNGLLFSVPVWAIIILIVVLA